MKRIAMAALLLCMMAAQAWAEARPMTRYAPGQRIDVGFNGDVRFMAGCEFEDGSTIMLVDTDFFEGYLLIDAEGFYYDSIGGGIPIAEGWQAKVTAQDMEHCAVELSDGRETLCYDFAFVPAKYAYEQVWRLERLECIRGDVHFMAEFSRWRVDMSQTQGGQTQSASVYYEFFREANNLDFAKLPRSLEEGKQLESRYPVAAVSPDAPTTRVNLREGPGTSYPRCGSLYSGTQLAIREMKDGWARVQIGDTTAYISADFLTFGAEIEQVQDARPAARLRESEWVDISRAPYRGGGGTATRTRGGETVRIIGEYNKQWRIVGTDAGSYFIEAENLR